MAEYISKDQLHEITKPFKDSFLSFLTDEVDRLVDTIEPADVQPVVRCKDCKHFHLDYFGEVNGVNIIVAHEICDLWAGGCRTMQNAFCSNGVRKDGENG